MRPPVYLDYNATTPVAPEVFAAMRPWFEERFGNPSSSHFFGQPARQAVAQARGDVAALVHARNDEIFFTGSATEADNLALLGVAHALPEKRHLIVSAIEHPAVTQPARHLERSGWEVTIVGVDTMGRVSPADVAAALRPDTALVSVMHANNEVGTIQQMAEISRLAHANGSLIHTDAAQSAGKVVIDVEELGVDLLTLAGHKFYAPKGVGALYVRHGTPILPVLFGADQEHGLRPGTENVPHIVGFGAAAKLAHDTLPKATRTLSALRDSLRRQLESAVHGLLLNGDPEHCLPNTLHVSFPGISGKKLLTAVMEEVAASLGSACHSEADAVSGVLAAMGIDAPRARGAVRFSVGRYTTENEIDRAVAAIVAAYKRIKTGDK